MYRTLCVSTLFVFFINLVRTQLENSNQTSLLENENRVNLSESEISRLWSLHSDVFEYLATYDRPITVSTRRSTKYHRRLKRTKNRWRNNSTRPTTRKRSRKKRKYPSPADRRDIIYQHFANIFSLFDEEKKENLTFMDFRPIKKSPCYLAVFSTFRRYCYYGYYLDGGMTKMRNLLARACLSHWLTTEAIVNVLQSNCKKRFKFMKPDLK